MILNRLRQFALHLTSLRWRLFSLFLVVGIVPLVFFMFSTTNETKKYYYKQLSAELSGQAGIVATYLSQQHAAEMMASAATKLDIDKRAKDGNARILVIDRRGVVLIDSNSEYTGSSFITPAVVAALEKKTPAPEGQQIQDYGTDLYAATYFMSEDREVLGVVLLIASADSIDSALRGIADNFFLTMLAMSGSVFVIVFFLSQLFIRPLKAILASVREISQGRLSERVKSGGAEEFRELGLAFNDMTSKLEQIESSRQEFVSNVSHELKTPLSAMKVLSESLLLTEDVEPDVYREFLGDIVSEIDRMTRINNELLQLVKLDRTEQILNTTQLNVNDMAEEILHRLKPIADLKEISLALNSVKNVSIQADEMKLSLAISNLVENGIKYSDDGGEVKLTIDSDNQNCFITVSDKGIGIAEEDQPKVFTRFYRVDKTRDRETGGTGLGLSITHKTVMLHRGSIKLTSKEGEGTSFIVRLPIHRA
jgi:signal transduction histidine kinase